MFDLERKLKKSPSPGGSDIYYLTPGTLLKIVIPNRSQTNQLNGINWNELRIDFYDDSWRVMQFLPKKDDILMVIGHMIPGRISNKLYVKCIWMDKIIWITIYPNKFPLRQLFSIVCHSSK